MLTFIFTTGIKDAVRYPVSTSESALSAQWPHGDAG
jgi:hypothetical protein